MQARRTWQRRTACLGIAAALLAFAEGCRRSPGPILPKPTERDDLELVVERLQRIFDERGGLDSFATANVVGVQRLVHEYKLEAAADGRPATATIVIRTIPAHAEPAGPSPGELLASTDEPSTVEAPETTDDPPAADAEMPDPIDETYRLEYRDKVWRLVDAPATEVEKLWFSYALPE